MHQKSLLACVVLALSMLASGCATIAHGKYQLIAIETIPPGARASCGGEHIETPGHLRVKRSAQHLVVAIELSGYESAMIALERSLSGSLFWDALALPIGAAGGAEINHDNHGLGFSSEFGGAIVGGLVLPAAFVAVDLGTGAAYRQTPTKINVVLKRTTQ